MIEIKVNVTDGASQTLRTLIASISGAGMSRLNEQAGRAAVNSAIAYHHEFDKSGGWRGKRYLGPSQGEGSNFGSDVARGWNFRSSSPEGAIIANDATYYAFKVRGGVITPKRAKSLTIPLIAEARGLRARVYSQNTGHRLFTIRGRNALFERIEESVMGARGKRGQAGSTAIKKSGIRAVYALVKSITQIAWPNAMPPAALIASAFATKFREGIRDILKKS